MRRFTSDMAHFCSVHLLIHSCEDGQWFTYHFGTIPPNVGCPLVSCLCQTRFADEWVQKWFNERAAGAEMAGLWNLANNTRHELRCLRAGRDGESGVGKRRSRCRGKNLASLQLKVRSHLSLITLGWAVSLGLAHPQQVVTLNGNSCPVQARSHHSDQNDYSGCWKRGGFSRNGFILTCG